MIPKQFNGAKGDLLRQLETETAQQQGPNDMCTQYPVKPFKKTVRIWSVLSFNSQHAAEEQRRWIKILS